MKLWKDLSDRKGPPSSFVSAKTLVSKKIYLTLFHFMPTCLFRMYSKIFSNIPFLLIVLCTLLLSCGNKLEVKANLRQASLTTVLPVLNAILPLAGAVESTPFVITYPMLLAASNASVNSGKVASFRVQSHLGSLTKNGIPVVGEATLLSPGESWTWTPTANASGDLFAFSVKLWDGSEASLAAVAVLINVSPVPLSIVSLTMPPNQNYLEGSTLVFEVVYNKSVVPGAAQSLPLVLGTTMVSAQKTGQTLFSHFYSYTVLAGNESLSGLDMSQANTSLGRIGPATYPGIIVDALAPSVTGLTNSNLKSRSQTWNWGCAETCSYRYQVDTFTTWIPSGLFGASTSASVTLASGSGTYYLHVQARDAAGNIGVAQSYSAVIGLTPPTAMTLTYPGSPGFSSFPVINVAGVTPGETVSLHTSSSCTLLSQIGQAVASGTSVAVFTSTYLSAGRLEIYSRAMDAFANSSNCSAVHVDYELRSKEGNYSGQYVPLITGLWPESLAAGDFNNDGVPDLVTADRDSNQISVFIGQGSGVYAARIAYPTGAAPLSVAVIDATGDGLLDILTADSGSNTISLYRGNGVGGFETRLIFLTGSEPTNVTAEDVTSDGFKDLISTDRLSNVVSLFPGNGFGGFGTRLTIATGSQPNSLAIADVTGDGHNDIITADNGVSRLSITAANGAGGFLARTTLLVGNNTTSVRAADITGDGIIDIVASNQGSDTISVFIGTGPGTFAPRVNYATEVSPTNINYADVTGDGYIDLLVTHSGAGISIYAGAASSVFQLPVNLPTGHYPRESLILDVTGDSVSEIITVDSFSDQISIMSRNTSGSFVPTPEMNFGGSSRSILADVNKDGFLDLISSNSVLLDIRLGDGLGNFALPQTYPEDFARELVVSDVNGDSNVDIISLAFSDKVEIYLGQGSGVFLPQPFLTSGLGSNKIVVKDVTGDGRNDILTSDSTANEVSLFIQSVSNTFGPRTALSMGTTPKSLTVADVNGDGIQDILTADSGSSTVSFLRGSGGGAFLGRLSYATGTSPSVISVADITGDGFLDIISLDEGSGTASLIKNNGLGGFLAKATISTGTNLKTLNIADMNKDGSLDLIIGSYLNIQYLKGHGNGTFDSKIMISKDHSFPKVKVADITGDGHLDLLVGDAMKNNVTLVEGTGDGSFLEPKKYRSSEYCYDVSYGDINNDGVIDFIANWALGINIFLWKP